MLTKIILVTILVVLSWSSLKLSNNSEILRTELKELSSKNESLSKLILDNQDLLKAHAIDAEKDLKLSELNTSILQKITVIETNYSKLVGVKKSIDGVKVSVTKQTEILKNNKKVITALKKPIYETLDTVKKQSKVYANKSSSIISKVDANKKAIDGIKKPIYQTLDIVKKQSKQLSSVTHHKLVNPVKTNKPAYKNMIKNNSYSIESKVEVSALNKVLIEFQKTKDLYDKKQTKNAIAQLAKLKSEVWKSRTIKNVSKDKVISILSSIDVTKKKWEGNEIEYNLDKVEKMISLLLPKTVEELVKIKTKTNQQTPVKAITQVEIPILNTQSLELNKAKKLNNEKEIKEALAKLRDLTSQLDVLKNQVSKNRSIENTSDELIKSILSSIDLVKKKWTNKEIRSDIENIEKKLNQLICKFGVCK